MMIFKINSNYMRIHNITDNKHKNYYNSKFHGNYIKLEIILGIMEKEVIYR